MTRERGQAPLDRLIVTDVDQDVVEHGQVRCRRRWLDPALVDQSEDSQRLERNGLAARVGSADHQRTEPGQRQVDRHRGRGIEQRVARALQRDIAGRLVDDASIPFERQRGTSDGQVDLCDPLHGIGQKIGDLADGLGELRQHALDLDALTRLQFAHPVVGLEDLQRLDKHGLPRGGTVVDDSRHR